MIFILQVKAASWALDYGVSVVVCNGKLDNSILNVVKGKNIGTFFTHAKSANTPVEVEAAQGKWQVRQIHTERCKGEEYRHILHPCQKC